ncbi:hypothetical protein Pla123a_37390 [Posidoniimonas polymericola]|uniref:Uncharacterized protein n=1 Tax=Posidoniimonas polymericola TaxID=2528002 RepID=A0A5C5YH43_9BACT|nr:hypothetical protein [Posidoniimonas polymericola]TWT73845.1 hypothetical protein Pla123a_37390 [Posidoniimonas polymericola]
MHVNFPEPNDTVVSAKAAASGFGDDVAAYLLHLVEQDDTTVDRSLDQNALEAFERLGLVGCIKDGPNDLSTNPKHMEGFGRDGQDVNPD